MKAWLVWHRLYIKMNDMVALGCNACHKWYMLAGGTRTKPKSKDMSNHFVSKMFLSFEVFLIKMFVRVFIFAEGQTVITMQTVAPNHVKKDGGNSIQDILASSLYNERKLIYLYIQYVVWHLSSYELNGFFLSICAVIHSVHWRKIYNKVLKPDLYLQRSE